ncbi:hypothetical protein [Aurantiacibacter sp. D1-12]|uniref:hypothetical protein n=1 Tax=Aurantiacibacter sp. D1-12 TaxID=2993658 RepID=UPI00237CE99B|nr:hypothetical protein [Aurantiacibacter sp. D1-12]MDE1467669.1 hypothetical protein [Aurantiacibacter sp. D1-12]
MTLSLNRAAQIIAIALIATVVTQILYVHFEVNGDPAIAYPIWRTEAYAFLAIGLAAFAFVRDMPIVAGGLIIGAVFNVIQTGVGIALFNPVFGGGEALAPLGGALVGFAFFLYHAAKVALAASAIAIGMLAWNGASGWPKIAGALAGVTGLIALLSNLAAMTVGRDLAQVAGGSGTAAVFFLALAIGAVRPVADR